MTAPASPPRTWLAPALLGVAGAAGVVTVSLVDPNEASPYPTCPFLAATGWWCPGCGTLRAVHALTRGDLATAVDLNVLVVAVLPLLVIAWATWLRDTLRGGTRVRDLPRWLAPVVAVVVPVFTVVRNLPVGSALAP